MIICASDSVHDYYYVCITEIDLVSILMQSLKELSLQVPTVNLIIIIMGWVMNAVVQYMYVFFFWYTRRSESVSTFW